MPPSLYAQEANSEEIHLTPAQIQRYEASLRDPRVVRLRKFFDTYAKGRTTDIEEKLASSSLASLKIDRKILLSKFVVFDIQGAMGGGNTIRIIFQENPDVILDVWTYTMENGSARVRDLWEANIKKEKKEILKKRLRILLEDPRLGI